MGWSFTWVSSLRNDFNFDFGHDALVRRHDQYDD
jgi:predicted dithiol-disulfide oxidoreductase (DUF899 family)